MFNAVWHILIDLLVKIKVCHWPIAGSAPGSLCFEDFKCFGWYYTGWSNALVQMLFHLIITEDDVLFCWLELINFRPGFIPLFVFLQIACKTASDAQKWRDAFLQAKDEVFFHLSTVGSLCAHVWWCRMSTSDGHVNVIWNLQAGAKFQKGSGHRLENTDQYDSHLFVRGYNRHAFYPCDELIWRIMLLIIDLIWVDIGHIYGAMLGI